MTTPAKSSDTSVAAGPRHLSAFLGSRRVAQGDLDTVRSTLKRALASMAGATPDADPGAAPDLRVFDDASGARIDWPPAPSGLPAVASAADAGAQPARRGVGRPKLGVVAKEVTLLPQHWEWLALQPGGASVTLRKLVHEARRQQAAAGDFRAAQERCYRFLQEMAGDLPGYEEALRALYRRDAAGFSEAAAAWPPDIREHARALGAGSFGEAAG